MKEASPSARFTAVIGSAVRTRARSVPLRRICITWNGRTGLVHEAILADFPDLSGCAIYACGSMQMIPTAKPAFLARGLPDDFCFSDVLKPQSMQIAT